MENAQSPTGKRESMHEDQSGQTPSRLVGLSPAHVLIVAFVVAIFSVLWFGSYQLLDNFIWDGGFVSDNRWTIPVGVMFFSLIVGLANKYLDAPNSIEGDALDPIVAGETTSYRRFWGTLTTSFSSLLSGASLGPEWPLGYLAVDVSGWLSHKMNLPKEGYFPAAMSSMSAAYNGIIGNSVFTAVMATETSGGKGGLPALAMNLAAGVVGYFVFTMAGVPPFAGSLYEGDAATLSASLVLWAIGLGLVGTLVALYIAAALRFAGDLMKRFDGKPLVRVLTAGAIIAIVCYFFPILMFAGEAPLNALMENPTQTTVITLILLAAAKPLLLALSLKSGYLGGPIFPCLFSAIMVGLALGQVFPNIPAGVITACIEAAVITLVLNAPLTGILLVTVITAADATLLELIVVASVTAMIAKQAITYVVAQRTAA